MTMNPLPPQAYTKDTLLKAYHWLQQQPSAIKEMAMTPELLVSLYLKASRDGENALERPSIQNFKTELKNLAGIMGELEGPKAAPKPSAAPPAAPEFSLNPVAPVTTAPAPATALEMPQVYPLSGLDAKTAALLKEVAEDFNLSSEAEALRMLVKIGYERTRGLLSPTDRNSQ